MNKQKILIVDDEPLILELLSFNIQKAGYEIFTADNGDDAIKIAQEKIPDLIILDRMMPGKDGLTTLKILRQNPNLDGTAIIFLTALSDDRSEIEGLETGADDYIAKPIKMDLLITRIQTNLRKNTQNHKYQENIIELNDLKIDTSTYIVTYKNQEFTLAKKEFELLLLMVSQPGKVFLRQEILEQIWGKNVIVGDRTIDVHIRKIRSKLNADFIKTVKGLGYKFDPKK